MNAHHLTDLDFPFLLANYKLELTPRIDPRASQDLIQLFHDLADFTEDHQIKNGQIKVSAPSYTLLLSFGSVL